MSTRATEDIHEGETPYRLPSTLTNGRYKDALLAIDQFQTVLESHAEKIKSIDALPAPMDAVDMQDFVGVVGPQDALVLQQLQDFASDLHQAANVRSL